MVGALSEEDGKRLSADAAAAAIVASAATESDDEVEGGKRNGSQMSSLQAVAMVGQQALAVAASRWTSDQCNHEGAGRDWGAEDRGSSGRRLSRVNLKLSRWANLR